MLKKTILVMLFASLVTLITTSAVSARGASFNVPGKPTNRDAALNNRVNCPALPAPAGPTVTVYSESALRNQAYNAAPGTTILIATGLYHLQASIQVIHNNITIRSATGNRSDVTLDAGGMGTGLTHGIWIDADDVTIANLTIRNVGENGVSIQGRDRPVLYNLHIQDTGSQLVKVNPVGDGSDDGLLACSRLEYTTTSPQDYTNGISAHNAHRWVVRDNEWYRIRTPGNAPDPTILFWSGSSDTVVERNVLANCYQGIAFGNASHGSGDHIGGIVRNNFIYAAMPHDSVIEMVHATGWLVANNTALLLNPVSGLTWGMEARFADTSGTFAYNLTNMDIINRDGAGGTMTGNVTTADSSWFLDPAGGNLHLLSSATGAIDQAASLPQVSDDIDGNPRPVGPAPDVGADERPADPPTPVTVTFLSAGAHDGWILESSETSNTGGALNAAAATINLGDDAAKKQYRGILSFNTASLPDNAVINAVSLNLKRAAVVGGGNPLAIFQGFMIDIKKGFFGTTALQPGDFQAAPSQTYGPLNPPLSAGWYSLNLTPSKAYINKLSANSGLTQIRLRFKLDDNNNAVANYLSLYSGNAPAVSRPQLVVTYVIP